MGKGRKAAIAALLLAVLVPAGAAAQTTGEVPTREEFVDRAEDICAVNYRKALRLLKKGGDLAGGGIFKPAGRKLMKAGRYVLKTNDRIAALEQPPADAAAIDEWLAGARKGGRNLIKSGRALKGGHPKEAEAWLERANRAVRRASRLVAGFGFRNCV
jgi:hypothetical protein